MPPGGFGFARRGVLSTTLAELCVAKLAEYASYIRELGPVPDELVADILRRSNISGANLEAIEEANAPRDLSPVTEALWNRLCERELKDTKKPDGITWRRYYRQRVDERAEKMARTKAAMKVRLAAARADAPAPVMSIRKKSGKGAPAPRKVVHKKREKVRHVAISAAEAKALAQSNRAAAAARAATATAARQKKQSLAALQSTAVGRSTALARAGGGRSGGAKTAGGRAFRQEVARKGQADRMPAKKAVKAGPADIF